MKFLLFSSRGLLVLGLVLGFAGFFVVGLGYAAYFDSVSHGEGSILVSTIEWFEGDGLYQPSVYTGFPAYLAIYPPVFYGIVGIANMLQDGWSLLPGRIICLISVLGVACLIGWSIMSLTRDRWAALIGGALYFCFFPILIWSGLHRVDPVATFFAFAGVACIIAKGENRYARVLAGLFFVLAIGTKHSFLAGWSVCCLGLFLNSRRQGLALFFGVLLSILGSFAILFFVTDGGIWYSLVTGLNHPFSFQQFKLITKIMVSSPLLLVCFFIVLLGYWKGCFGEFLEFSDKNGAVRRKIPAWFFAVALLQTLMIVAKKGSSVNYFMEVCAAVSLCSGLVLAWVRSSEAREVSGLSKRERTRLKTRDSDKRVLQETAICCLLGVALLITINTRWHYFVTGWNRINSIDHYSERAENLRKNVQSLTKEGDYILSRRQDSFIWRTGRSSVLNDPLLLSTLSDSGIWDETETVKALEEGKVALVVTDKELGHIWETQYFTDAMIKAIETHYQPIGKSNNWYLYVPNKK